MNDIFSNIEENILAAALDALAQANTHATYYDPGREHWAYMAVINAAHAGELAIKSIIAKQHPRSIFRNISDFANQSDDEIDIEELLKKAKTHDFHNLPKILWSVCRQEVPDLDSFREIKEMRNAVQHFYHPAGFENLGKKARMTSLKFIYSNIDPLLKKNFGIYAIDHHEDPSVGYDYIVGNLIRNEIRFSIPTDFDVSEISLCDELKDTSNKYRTWFNNQLD